ncbi:type I-E CRISPR-associated protein Cas6/Cse3/CasE [Providencia sp. PROV132]|uniref:type I-E CRISPR-associated protein Cas6/Cse3/CasE n=1 Tax=Providencia sp. PROV132 TaxID=2949842 RepID=UPI002348F4DC|nr:type I-E CRISPR-associated protein Cas6/Cse3/CasE [Providencia sp. PROV132]
MLRTAQAVGVPGEVKKSVYFSEGQEVTITGTIAAVRREVLNGRKRETCPPSEELPEFVKYRLSRAGLTPHHVGVNKMDRLVVKKVDPSMQKGHRIHIPACTFHATGVVSSVADFEKAFVFGIGRKRIFGVGQITVTTQ